jgi:hypothetical protein
MVEIKPNDTSARENAFIISNGRSMKVYIYFNASTPLFISKSDNTNNSAQGHWVTGSRTDYYREKMWPRGLVFEFLKA